MLLFFTRNLHMDNTVLPEVSYISDVRMSINNTEEMEITLPCSIKKLAPRTPVTVTKWIFFEKDDVMYNKTVYSPAKIYLDDKLVYEFGNDKNYPLFMKDPATEIYLIRPESFNKRFLLRIELLSPITRNVLSIYPPLIGTYKAVFGVLVGRYRWSFLVSIVQLATGFIFIIISGAVAFFEKKNKQNDFSSRDVFIFCRTVGVWRM